MSCLSFPFIVSLSLSLSQLFDFLSQQSGELSDSQMPLTAQCGERETPSFRNLKRERSYADGWAGLRREALQERGRDVGRGARHAKCERLLVRRRNFLFSSSFPLLFPPTTHFGSVELEELTSYLQTMLSKVLQRHRVLVSWHK